MSDGGDKTPDATEAERALAEVAVSRINRYADVFVPFENEYISEVFNFRSPGQLQAAGGQASAAVEDSFGAAEKNAAGELAARGVDPSSGAYQGTSRSLARAKERALGAGVAGANVDQTDRFYSGLQGVTAMGQGQSAETVEGMGAVASRANDNAAREAQTAFDKATAGQEVIGTAVGAASSYGLNRKGGT